MKKIITRNNDVKINTYEEKTKKIERICVVIVSLLSLIFFGIIAIANITSTAVIDPKKFALEIILFSKDNIFLNLLYIILFLLLALGLYTFRKTFLKITEKQLMIGLFIYTMTLGLIWVIKVQCVPAADAGQIYDATVSFVKGDMTPMTKSTWEALFGDYSYFKPYPYQLGLVFLGEFIYKIFGYETALPLEIMNVVSLALLYLGLQKIAMRLFHKKQILFILTFLLAMCLQPIFVSAFPYGLIIGFSAAVWAYYFVLRFMQSTSSKNALWMIPATLLMVISILAKYNNMIWLVAIAIAMVFYIIKKKDWPAIILLVGFCLVSAMSLNLVINHYEKKSNVELGDGVSQILYLDMGFNESYMAPGWYNGKALSLYMQNEGNIEKAEEAAKEDLKERMEKFTSDFGYTRDFFLKKIVSQWNEPTYESIWASQVKGHYYGNVEEYSWLNKVYYQLNEDGTPIRDENNALIYEGSWGQKLNSYFNIYNMIMYLLFCVAMVSLIAHKCNYETLVMIMVLIGGFLYHLLFEAKSQYSVTYFILIVFFAAYGLLIITKKMNKFRVRLNEKKRTESKK